MTSCISITIHPSIHPSDFDKLAYPQKALIFLFFTRVESKKSTFCDFGVVVLFGSPTPISASPVF
jgi:hypothetical protein